MVALSSAYFGAHADVPVIALVVGGGHDCPRVWSGKIRSKQRKISMYCRDAFILALLASCKFCLLEPKD